MTKSYEQAKREHERRGEQPPPIGNVRTDYSCRANGCPNTATMDDGGAAHPGRCYYHWRESDPARWDAITREIRANFGRMRNWDPPPGYVMPEIRDGT